MICSETISVMLPTHEKWKTLTARPIAPKASSEVGSEYLVRFPRRG